MGVRKVRTPEGSRFYDLPIGSPITADAIKKAKVRVKAGSLPRAGGGRAAQRPYQVRAPSTPARTEAARTNVQVLDRMEADIARVGERKWASTPRSKDKPALGMKAMDEMEADIARVGERAWFEGKHPQAKVSYAMAGDQVHVKTERGEVALAPELQGALRERLDQAGLADRGSGADIPDVSEPPKTRSTQQTLAKPGESFSSSQAAADSLVDKAAQVEPEITKTMTSIADKIGAQLDGLDFRLKSRDSMRRKVALEAEETGDSFDEVAASIKDAVRYTMVFEETDMVKRMNAVLEEFRRLNYKIQTKNTWRPGVPYKGVNVSLTTPEGYRLELQFHTKTSLEIKEINHKLYEQFRLLAHNDPKRISLLETMRSNAAQVPDPDDILDFEFRA